MILKHTCPCCDYLLLCHIRSQGVYWLCAYCYQEMPILEALVEIQAKSTLEALTYSSFNSQTSQTGRVCSLA
ncbi:MAG: hypothetical protein LDL41_16540 [Coleofasciculus sp. S288]|nr:hypothetical protein [Coleofasciculus sp. S288]